MEPTAFTYITDMLQRTLKIKKFSDDGNLACFKGTAFGLQNLRSVLGCQSNFQALEDFLTDSFISVQNLTEPTKDGYVRQSTLGSSESGHVENTDLDLTGCPLESPFDLSVAEEDNLPLNSNNNNGDNKISLVVFKASDARFLLNKFINNYNQCANLPSVAPWVLLLCDGLDPLQTALLAATMRKNTVHHLVIHSSTGTLSFKELPLLSLLKIQHCDMFCKKNIKIETTVCAKYVVLQGTPLTPSSLTLNCRWRNPLALLDPPNSDSDCTLELDVYPGNEESSAFSLYKDLAILKCATEGLLTGEMIWSIKSSELQETLENKILNLIQETKAATAGGSRASGRRQEETESAGASPYVDLQAGIKSILVGKRQNMDFTDLLWNTLKDATSYAELHSAFIVVTEAIKNKEISPMILRQNDSSLGQWVKDIRKGKTANRLCLEDKEPLRHLAEIGLRKLQKDYRSIFIGLGLAPQGIWSPFLEDVSGLELLHVVLELVLLCAVHLRFPQHLLARLVAKTLKSGNSETIHNFTFSIPVKELQQLLKIKSPSEWQVCLTSSDSIRTLTSGSHLSLNNTFPHLHNPRKLEDLDEPRYYSTSFLHLKENIP